MGAQAQPNVNQLLQANANARQIIRQRGKEVVLQLFQTTLAGTIPGQVINVTPRNVGLLKRFIVKIEGNVAQGAAETQTRSKWGPANFLSNVSFTDLSNYNRISTPGWHLHAVATAKRGNVFGAAYTNDSPVDMGSSLGAIKLPASVTTVQPFRMFYEIPIVYGDVDLRGLINAAVTGANMNLQLTVNPNLGVASTGDDTLAVFKSSTTQLPAWTNIVVTVYQVFIDQVPPGVLPILDMGYAYYLQNTQLAGFVASQDNPIQYANQHEFMSTTVIYDNNGTLNPGTDINYWALQAANSLNFFKLDPFTVSLRTRMLLGNDFPQGSYYFDHRGDPINTINYGNMQLLLNPSSVSSASGTIAYVGWESLGAIQMVLQGQSLPASG